MATSAHTSVPGGAKPPFPPFNKDYFASQFIWFAIFFVALYLIIAKLAIPQIGGIMAARSKHVADDLAEANSLKEQSDAALGAYEKALADARGRAQALANETRDKLNAEAEKTRKVLEGNLNTKLAEAEKTIASTKARPWPTSKRHATDTAIAIVERLIGTAPSTPAVAAGGRRSVQALGRARSFFGARNLGRRRLPDFRRRPDLCGRPEDAPGCARQRAASVQAELDEARRLKEEARSCSPNTRRSGVRPMRKRLRSSKARKPRPSASPTSRRSGWKIRRPPHQDGGDQDRPG